MQIAVALLSQCLVMFALMGTGLILHRTHLISDGTAKELGSVLLNLVFPVVIIRSFWGHFSIENLHALIATLFISLAALVVAMVIARAFFPHTGSAEFAAAFSNAGFIGIPLVSAVFGEQAVFYIACFIAELNILQWTYGKWRISGSTESISPRSVLTSPMLIGFLLGVLLFLTNTPTLPVVDTVMTSIANLNSPLAMIILGTYLSRSSLGALFATPRPYKVSFVRLVVIPLATLLLLLCIPGAREMKLAILIAAAAPAGSNVAVFCQQLDADPTAASNDVCLSTLLSLISMPALMVLAASVL